MSNCVKPYTMLHTTPYSSLLYSLLSETERVWLHRYQVVQAIKRCLLPLLMVKCVTECLGVVLFYSQFGHDTTNYPLKSQLHVELNRFPNMKKLETQAPPLASPPTIVPVASNLFLVVAWCNLLHLIIYIYIGAKARILQYLNPTDESGTFRANSDLGTER